MRSLPAVVLRLSARSWPLEYQTTRALRTAPKRGMVGGTILCFGFELLHFRAAVSVLIWGHKAGQQPQPPTESYHSAVVTTFTITLFLQDTNCSALGCLQPRFWGLRIPEALPPIPEDRSALTTHAK